MKYRHAKTQGNEAENIIESWLQLAGVEFKRENTQKGRRKGTVDFDGELICFDVKKYTYRLTFAFKSDAHDIKWQQIEYLYQNRNKVSGLICTEDCLTFYFVDISVFISRWLETSTKHLKSSEIDDIGVKITCYEDLRRLVLS